MTYVVCMDVKCERFRKPDLINGWHPDSCPSCGRDRKRARRADFDAES